MRPVPGGSRWARRSAPKGSCTVTGIVRDEVGEPVAGAQVYRMKPDAKPDGDSTVCSFRYLRKVATSGPDGRFIAKELPAGRYALVANLRSLLNRRRGMECRAATPVALDERQILRDVSLTLPLLVGDLGVIEGRLVDENGRPIPRAEIFAGFKRGRADDEGRFRFEDVAAGTVEILVRQTGYLRKEVAVDAPRGATVPVEIVLVLREKGGLTLSGTTRDSDGNPVAGARVFVGHGQGGLRAPVRAGEDGSYSLEDLPDRCGRDGVMLSIHAAGFQGTSRKDVLLPAADVDFVLVRSVTLRILVREAGSGDPIPTFNLRIQREVVEGGEVKLRHVMSAAVYSEEGTHDRARLIPGRHVVLVEAPDREPVRVAMDIPDTPRPKEVLIEMR